MEELVVGAAADGTFFVLGHRTLRSEVTAQTDETSVLLVDEVGPLLGRERHERVTEEELVQGAAAALAGRAGPAALLS